MSNDHPHTRAELIPEEPPKDRRGNKSKIEPWLDDIRVRPGVWFRYPTRVTPSSQQVAVRYRAVEGHPMYEATFRSDPEMPKTGTVRPGWIYARYIGKPDPIH